MAYLRGAIGRCPHSKNFLAPKCLLKRCLTGYYCYLILRKITKFVATRRQILRLKCTKLNFVWGSAPDPAGGACSASPDPLAGFKGPTSNGREGKRICDNESSRYCHMFVRSSVCLSVWTGVHCYHTVHVSADLSLRLDSPRFWAL